MKFKIMYPGNVKGEKFKTLVCRKAGANPDWRGEHHTFQVNGNLCLMNICAIWTLILPDCQDEKSLSA